MQALADFAGGMTLDPAEIDKERGVVVEEWRGGLGAGSRLRDQQIPVLFYESKYAERLPIGKPEILKTFKPDRLRAFYTKWYRPDRMAVVAVGDVDRRADRSADQDRVRCAAEAGGGRAGPRLRRAAAVRAAGQGGHRSRGARSPRSRLIRQASRAKRTDTVGAYRRDLVHRLAFQMLNERFDELSRKPDAQFLDAGAYESGLSPIDVDRRRWARAVQEGKILRRACQRW